MAQRGIEAALELAAAACAASVAWLAYRRRARERLLLLRRLFAAAAAAAGAEPAAVLVVQAARSGDAELGRQIAAAPADWYVALAGPEWLAGLKSAAWGRPVGLMSELSPGDGALRDDTYLALRRGQRFELIRELPAYMEERLG